MCAQIKLICHHFILKTSLSSSLLRDDVYSSAFLLMARYATGNRRRKSRIADTASLLRFLRTSKFSQLRARSMIEAYLGLKMEFPSHYNNCDPCDPAVAKYLKAGCV